MAAVRDGRGGSFERAKQIVESVRSKAGDAAAERAKKEIWDYIKSEKRA
jgi:predicted transcriptional regulator